MISVFITVKWDKYKKTYDTKFEIINLKYKLMSIENKILNHKKNT